MCKTFAQKPKVSTLNRPRRAQRTLQTHAEKTNAGLTTALSPRFGHDFSRISIHSSPFLRAFRSLFLQGGKGCRFAILPDAPPESFAILSDDLERAN
jgi:hypothetical protein